MAISRSLMNRQLRASGGIMDVTPRENFGLGSSLKKFVRKIIPNEVAEIATKAAPFVAPFNPALAGVMSGVGTFDQTGSIGSGLKAGAMNYGGGQLARYVGGGAQNLQGNPFTSGAFTPSGFRGGFSSPISDQGGLGKLFSNQGTDPVQGINSGRGGDSASALSRSTANTVSGGAETLANASELSFVPNNATSALVDASDMALVGDVKQAAAKEFNLFKAVGDFDYKSLGNKTLELGKKFGKAAFYDKDGNIDKAAVMGAIAFAGSYAEALALADDAGVELTEEIYDEAKKEAKQEQYAGYLENFFAGQKDGGRIGYEQGANELMSDIIMRGEMDIDDLGIRQRPSTVLVMVEGPSGVEIKEVLESDARRYNLNIVSDSGEFANKGSEIDFSSFGKKDGGRIGYEGGANELIKNKLTEDIMQDTSTEEMIMIMTEDGPKMVKKSDYEAMPGMFRDTTTSLYGDAARGRPVPEFAKGGRIGYEQGANEYITKKERQNPMAGSGLLGGIDPTIDESDQNIIIVMTENGPQAMTESEFNEQMGINNGTGPIVIDMMNFGDEKKPRIIDLGKDMKKGGRVNRRFGSPEKGEGDGLMEMLSVDVDAGGDDEEDMKMAGITFSSAEKSYLFRKLGGAGGSDRSFTMPQLYRVLSNPDRYTEDAAVLKEIAIMGLGKKDGGRIGYKNGTGSSNRVAQLILERDYLLSKDEDVSYIDVELESLGYKMRSEGGVMDVKMPTGQIRENNAGVVERDYRDEGGFVPVGIKERADDVPAMLSKNEFVMTADAVRGIGNGSVEEGSKKLYNTMKQAEQVGKA